MGWLLLAAAAVALFVFSKKENRIVQVRQNEDGTWSYFVMDATGGVVLQTDGPFESELAARAAAAAWLATGPTTPLPEPIDVVPAGPQGDAPLPEAPPLVAPYLTVSGGGVVGNAVVEGDRVRWIVGGESDVAGSAVSANATLLSRVDSRAVLGAPVRLSLRKSDGRLVQARVSKVVGPAAPWAWSVTNPPAVPGGVGTSTTRPEWRAATRLAAMRGALTTLQDV